MKTLREQFIQQMQLKGCNNATVQTYTDTLKERWLLLKFF
jgi:hypothetical protein